MVRLGEIAPVTAAGIMVRLFCERSSLSSDITLLLVASGVRNADKFDALPLNSVHDGYEATNDDGITVKSGFPPRCSVISPCRTAGGMDSNTSSESTLFAKAV